MKNHSLQSQFFKSIAERGFEPPKSAIIDGKFHRFSTNHASSDTAGWYVLNQDGDIVYGGFGDHRSDLKVGWSSKDETRMSLSERKKYDAEKIRIFEKFRSLVFKRHFQILFSYSISSANFYILYRIFKSFRNK